MKNGRDFNAEFQTRSEDDKHYIEGYFVRFDDKYQITDTMFETISPKAFDNITRNDVVCLWNHDTNYPLGRTSNNTLQLRVDNVGVYGKVEINPQDQFAMDAYARIQRGDVKQCSFGFNVVRETPMNHEDGTMEWRLEELDTHEISPVTFPAYKSTTVQARSADLDDIRKRAIDAQKTKLKERLNKIAENLKT